MTLGAALVLAVWLLVAVLGVWVWLPVGVGPAAGRREQRPIRIVLLVVLGLLAATAVVLAVTSGPVPTGWRWVLGALAATVAVIGGGAVTVSVLALAGSATTPSARVQRDVLRGGAWIGALERLALLATLVAGWPEGLAVIVAVKGLARYPELRSLSGGSTGANERFIIGTFASLGWAATTAWALTALL